MQDQPPNEREQLEAKAKRLYQELITAEKKTARKRARLDQIDAELREREHEIN